MKNRKTEIIVETEEQIVFHRASAREIEMICPDCKIDSVFLAPERAAFLYGLSTREIFRSIERDTVHFFETGAGATLVCAASLSARSGKPTDLDLEPKGEVYEGSN